MTLEECVNKYGLNVWLAHVKTPKVKICMPKKVIVNNDEFFIVYASWAARLGIPMEGSVRMVRENPNNNFCLYEGEY